MPKKGSQSLLIPGAIVLAGILISMALFARGSGGGQIAQVGSGHGGSFGNALSRAAENIVPVTNADHVRGNPDAPVKIVEFSDYECPFCARLHPTLGRALDEFPDDVAWVYRHFPLSIHRNAVPAAVAAECVAQLSGNDAFWEFSDALFANQRGLNAGLYTNLAGDLGVNADDFARCLLDEDMVRSVQGDLQDATRSGGRGTPYSVIISGSGNVFPFSGALPYEQIRQVLEQAIADS